MSLTGPRGRHRAPSKLQVHFGSAARVTATVAVSGGLVAAIAGPQAAHAEGVAAISPSVQRAAATTLDASTAKTITAAYEKAAPVQDLGVQGDVNPVKEAATRKAAADAAKARAATARRAQQTSRSQQRTAPAPKQASTPPNHSTTPPQQSDPQPPSKPAPPKPTPPAPPQSGGSSHSSAVAIAKRYIGTPYVWGGASPSGFDCSGLTMYVYAQMGISIPRTASAQQSALHSVSSPQPGDLVFFGSPAYHVGIYVGNGMMIDAPKPGKSVQVRKIWTTPTGYGRP